MFRSRPISLALVVLFLWVTGCTSYRQIELAEVTDYGKVRVTFADGERIVSDSATVAGDSIHYWEKAESGSRYSKVRVSSPLDEVSVFEVRVTDAAKTAGLVIGVLALGVGLCAAVCELGIGYGSGN